MYRRLTRAAWMMAMATSMATTSAHAAFSMTPGMDHCTGTLTIDTTTDPGQIALICDGSYTLTDGAITADRAVLITASSIVLNGALDIDVPSLILASDTTVIGNDAALAVQQPPVLQSPTVPSIGAGATISIAQEPPRAITTNGSVSAPGGGLQLTASPLVITQPPSVASGASVPASPSAASSSGGGGAFDPWALLGLSALLAGLVWPGTFRHRTNDER